MKANPNASRAAVLVWVSWVAVACGSGGSSTFPGGSVRSDAGAGSTPFGSGDAGSILIVGSTDGGPPLGADATIAGTLSVTPPTQTITVTVGMPLPTATFQTTINGAPVAGQWTNDLGEVGVIDDTGVFTPSGTTAGTVTISASADGQSASAMVTVKIVEAQNGGTTAELGADAGSGGYGGVGGAGIGPAVTDPATLGLLQSVATAAGGPGDGGAVEAGGGANDGGSAQGFSWLYPYDGTVWPRGLLAPLLQWTWGGAAGADAGDAGVAVPPIDGIAIHLQTASGSFVYDGVFAAPTALAGAPFVAHPIPQDAWAAATNSASGSETLSVALTVASGGTLYGPLTETWTVAPARLTGTVYYNSYMTNLLTNSDFNAQGRYWGAGVLGIRVGDTNPTIVAGTNDQPGQTHGTGCRACHSVAANGSVLIAQQGASYPTTSSYNLLAGNTETVVAGFPNTFGWAALSPDGNLAVTNTVNLAAEDTTTQVYAFPPAAGATPIMGTGLDGVLAATPAFSPDGKHIAFTLHGGTVAGGITGGNGMNDTQVIVMDYDGTTFTNARAVFTIPAAQVGGACVGFPSFTPDDQAVVIQLQLQACGQVKFGSSIGTGGVQGEIWWAPIAGGAPIRLNALNGKRADGSLYLPQRLDTHHADDSIYNYEPTINPVVSGGYAWVVFTSRRLYGNVATIDPMLSDPRDMNFDPLTQATPKKLWVAAVALNAGAGSDPSYPAFYLPAQELYAGNSRGFWVLNPCAPDGQSCTSGDQCCNGYCEPAGEGGALVCGKKTLTTTCSHAQERCATAADCCDTTSQCIDGFCALPPPR